MVGRGQGQKGFEGGNRSPRDHLVWSGLYASSTAFVSATSARYCALVSLNSTEGESLKGAGKLRDHYFFKCVIAINDDRQYSSCGIRGELGLPSSASTSWLSPPFPHGPLHTCSATCSLGCIIPNRPPESSFQTSVPKTLAKSPRELMTMFICGKEANCAGSLKEKD